MIINCKTAMTIVFSLTCALFITFPLQAQVNGQAAQAGQAYSSQVQGQTYTAPQAQHNSPPAQRAAAQAHSHGGTAHAHGATANPNASVIHQLEDIIHHESHSGRTPANTRMLADLQILIGRYSFVAPPVPIPMPTVNITNKGGGTLRIVKPDGSFQDLGSFRSTSATLTPGRTTLISLGGDVNADFSLSGNVPCKLHDCDRNGGGNFQLDAHGVHRVGSGVQRFYPFERMFTNGKNGCYYLEP